MKDSPTQTDENPLLVVVSLDVEEEGLFSGNLFVPDDLETICLSGEVKV